MLSHAHTQHMQLVFIVTNNWPFLISLWVGLGPQTRTFGNGADVLACNALVQKDV